METVAEDAPLVAENQGQSDIENAKSKGKKLLAAAAANDTALIMEYLLEGVDPNVEDPRTWVSSRKYGFLYSDTSYLGCVSR